jgi:hypothetical protein
LTSPLLHYTKSAKEPNKTLQVGVPTSQSGWKATSLLFHAADRCRIGLPAKHKELPSDDARKYTLNTMFYYCQCLLTIQCGGIGMAPHLAQPGGKICVLFGCSFLVVLRDHGDYYEPIGECYPFGFVNGKAIEDYLAGKRKEKYSYWVKTVNSTR